MSRRRLRHPVQCCHCIASIPDFRIVDKPEHCICQRRHLRRHRGPLALAGGIELLDRMGKETQRVLQQRIARFEGLDERLLISHGGSHPIKVLIISIRKLRVRPQAVDGTSQVLDRLDQRIIVAEKTAPRPEHVSLQRRLVEKQRPQCREGTVMTVCIGGCEWDQQIGQHQQHARHDQYGSLAGDEGLCRRQPA
jgi:hypothetical protein